ncbi:hypothetical protein J2W42_006895 [Rhizobium tibeticum]|nr:hypothetical protein [Rhizobium tibeticum]
MFLLRFELTGLQLLDENPLTSATKRVDFAIEFLSSYKNSKYISNIEVYLLDKLFGWMVCAYFRTRTLR